MSNMVLRDASASKKVQKYNWMVFWEDWLKTGHLHIQRVKLLIRNNDVSTIPSTELQVKPYLDLDLLIVQIRKLSH